ncbi:hypothetical protein [Pseudoduganella aquatica]|uniref:Uncharacterized protein n=1 Tax=Pseudoduganella aquatica TaxID=2660641 RepID=A0A7X4HFH1_9BURK|nr:hypothetical protein [Pseudoduganella aquatica]MYN10296.1 hypothetical protein [Pseudoduganella aquatica]
MKTPAKEGALALALVPDTLTNEERRMVARYRATAPEWRADIVEYANMVARMFPLSKLAAAPGIRLVGAGDKGDAP